MGTRSRLGCAGIAQVGVVLAAVGLYQGLRPLVEGSAAEARRNTETVRDAERALGLHWEERLQDVFLDSDGWVTFWNVIYQWLYWPSVAGGLVLLWWLDRERYADLRNALFVSALMGLVIFATFPVAPPRFLPEFVDTLQLDGMRSNSRGSPWVNAYAAVPSFHVGWPALAGAAVFAHYRRSWVAAMALLPAVLIVGAVVITGNHFFLDIAAGLAVVAASHLLVTRLPATLAGESSLVVPAPASSAEPST